MSWNAGAFGATTVSARAQALRDQHEHMQRQARQTREDDNMPTTPTGIKRVNLRTKEVKSAIGSLNQKLNTAHDEVREALLRESDTKRTERAERSDDATRAPALGRDR